MTGPKPKPTTLKVLEGNPGKRKLNKNEPKPKAPDSLTPPDELDTEGKRAWERLAKQLDGAGLFTAVDRDALILYCESWSKWIRATKRVRRDGMVYKTSTGNLRINPILQVADEASKMMQKLMAGFGMTPADRTRITVAAKPEDDEFTQHQKKRFEEVQ